MHGDLRVVCACLNAQVAVGSLGIQLVGGEVRESLQCGWLPVGESESIFAVLAEQRWTEPEGNRQARWG
jgi:hypothetical protein